MIPSASLALTGRARTGAHRASGAHPAVQIVGASRPSAVRALLARSITMTAYAIERRVRLRRRHPDTQAWELSLIRHRERQAARARHESHRTDAGAARTLFSIR